MKELFVFVACELVLEKLEQEKWNALTWVTFFIHVRLKLEAGGLPCSASTLRPYAQWFIYTILVWWDIPPRFRYKVRKVGKVRKAALPELKKRRQRDLHKYLKHSPSRLFDLPQDAVALEAVHLATGNWLNKDRTYEEARARLTRDESL